MKNNSTIFGVMAIGLIILGGWYLSSSGEVGSDTLNSNSDTEAIADKSESEKISGLIVADKQVENNLPEGAFVDYEESRLSSDEHKNKVLFFHASWCPSCKALEADLNSSDIPNDTIIYKLDYDEELDLRKKYPITTQHSLVLVDDKGNMITSWRGGNTLDTITTKIQ